MNEIANRVPLTESGNLDIFDSRPTEYLPTVRENHRDALEPGFIPLDERLWKRLIALGSAPFGIRKVASTLICQFVSLRDFRSLFSVYTARIVDVTECPYSSALVQITGVVSDTL